MDHDVTVNANVIDTKASLKSKIIGESQRLKEIFSRDPEKETSRQIKKENPKSNRTSSKRTQKCVVTVNVDSMPSTSQEDSTMAADEERSTSNVSAAQLDQLQLSQSYPCHTAEMISNESTDMKSDIANTMGKCSICVVNYITQCLH